MFNIKFTSTPGGFCRVLKELVVLFFVSVCGSPVWVGPVRPAYGGAPPADQKAQDWVVVAGDILVRSDELQEDDVQRLEPRAVTAGRLWPGGVIPYLISSGFDETFRGCIQEAIEEWNTKTVLRLVPYSRETDAIVFTPSTTNASPIGMRGGMQELWLTTQAQGAICARFVVVHEIGHAAGLLHEHQRPDRERYVRILTENLGVHPDQYALMSSGSQILPYDYSSVMHYTAYQFSKNSRATIETIPKGILVGSYINIRNGLSDGDIDAVNRLYGRIPTATTITTNPPNLEVIVDGARVRAPARFEWAAGTTHRIEAVSPQSQDGARYEFGRWNDDGAQAHVITAEPQLTTLIAHFVCFYLFGVTVGDPTKGAVASDPPMVGEYQRHGDSFVVTASPAPGYEFSHWGPLLPVSIGNSTGYRFRGGGSSTVFAVLPFDLPAIAVFRPFPTTILETRPAGLRIVVNGRSYVSPVSFQWTPDHLHTVSVPEKQTATTSVRYSFQHWDAPAGVISADSRIKAPYRDTKLTAVFGRQFALQTHVSPVAAGQIAHGPASSDGYYDEGAQVAVTATAKAPFRFVRWTGHISGTINPATVTLDRPLTATAEFATGGLLTPSGIVNGASLRGGATAPLEILSIYAQDIGPEQSAGPALDAEGRFRTILNGVRVWFDGTPAPLLHVSRNQINLVTPSALQAKRSVGISVERDGIRGNTIDLEVEETAPAVFSQNGSGRRRGAILNQDGSLNTAENPAAAGSVIVIFATGLGALDGAAPDGSVARPPYLRTQRPVRVFVGEREAEVLYAGAAPGLVLGAYQVNARVPAGVNRTDEALIVLIGGVGSQPDITVAVR